MSDRKAVIKAWSSQYRKASKKEKGRVLDELVALTGYNRWYVVGLLRWDGKAIRAGRRVRLGGGLRKVVGGEGLPPCVWGGVVGLGGQGPPRRATGASGGGFAQEGQTHQT